MKFFAASNPTTNLLGLKSFLNIDLDASIRTTASSIFNSGKLPQKIPYFLEINKIIIVESYKFLYCLRIKYII